MSGNRRTCLVAILAAVILAGAAEPSSAACLSQREARRAVASGEALRLSEITGSVEGDIVNAELCDRRGRLVYQLAVIRGGGKVATVVVDAATGEVLR
jgi:uncharacterized membrane protein YkoI